MVFSIDPDLALSSLRSLFIDLFKKRDKAINDVNTAEEKRIDNQIKSLVNVVEHLPKSVSQRIITSDITFRLKELI